MSLSFELKVIIVMIPQKIFLFLCGLFFSMVCFGSQEEGANFYFASFQLAHHFCVTAQQKDLSEVADYIGRALRGDDWMSDIACYAQALSDNKFEESVGIMAARRCKFLDLKRKAEQDNRSDIVSFLQHYCFEYKNEAPSFTSIFNRSSFELTEN